MRIDKKRTFLEKMHGPGGYTTVDELFEICDALMVEEDVVMQYIAVQKALTEDDLITQLYEQVETCIDKRNARKHLGWLKDSVISTALLATNKENDDV